ncbi:helix-turn-helix domain-containing protein [Streptomyces sp. NPDC006173]|uniref:helix-turn-helix domain-containing protein n=1 Tax=Streptomyces sp. NPDC006173 TaxID=3155349 RepID=UPI0033F9A8E6
MAEYRYRAVREVLGGSPIVEVAARYGTSRQTLHNWRRRFEQEGVPGLLDRSRRPRNSPTRLSAEVEAEICELRHRRYRGHPIPDPAWRGRTRCQAPQEPRADHQALRQRHGHPRRTV